MNGTLVPRAAKLRLKIDLNIRKSMEHGDRHLHLLFVYVREKLRRLLAWSAELHVSETWTKGDFLSYRVADHNNVTSAQYSEHCDESSYSFYHHSAVLWLTSHTEENG